MYDIAFVPENKPDDTIPKAGKAEGFPALGFLSDFRGVNCQSTPFRASTMSIFRFFRATMMPTNSDTPKVSTMLTM